MDKMMTVCKKMNYKRDASLHGENGKEITIPICSYKELKDLYKKECKSK